MYIREYMHTDVITVSPDTCLPDAEKVMNDHNIRRLPVMDKGKLVGFLTQKDIIEARPSLATSLTKWELNYLLAKLKVKEIMVKTKNLVTVTPDTTVEDAISLGQEHKVGAFPVLDNGKMVGIVTITDLLNMMVQALGLGQKGVRLHIFDCASEWQLKSILETTLFHKANIQSLFQVVGSTGKKDIIIRLDTIDTFDLVNDLRSHGYTVETRWK